VSSVKRSQVPNRVQEYREAMLLSKAELARRAGVSPLTIDRIERGKNCRLETKRKVILALGFELEEKAKVFFDLAPERERSGGGDS